MATYTELIKQKHALEVLIEETRRTEMAEAIGKTKSLVAEYGLTVQDIFGGATLGRKAGSNSARKARSDKRYKAVPKYKDPASGATWSGRGRAPNWMAGKNKEDLLIN